MSPSTTLAVDPSVPADTTSRTAVRSIGSLPNLLTAFGALLLTVVYLPGLYAVPITARIPIVLIGAASGLTSFVLLLRRRDRPSLWLAAFLSWSLLSALLASAPIQALVPQLGSDNGWILIAASACWYTLGRRLDGRAARAVSLALVIGMLANVLLSLVQALSDGRGTELLDFTHGRSMGFFGNPVYLGGFLCGSLVLVAVATHRTERREWWIGAVLVAVASAGINLSGSRVALVGGVVVTVLSLHRGRRRRALVILAAIVVGLVASWGVIPASGGARVGDDASGGFTPRIETWKAGAEALTERPIFGWGPGRWLEATAPRTTLEQATTESANSVYDNAHNVVMEQLVTTGIVGLLLLAGFVWQLLRTARGPCAWFAVGVAVTWMLEPNHIGTTTLAFLALGVATRDDLVAPADLRRDRRLTHWGTVERLAAGVLTVAAIALVVPYVAADVHLARADSASTIEEQLDERLAGHAWLPTDPLLSDHVATARARIAVLGDDDVEGRRAYEQALRTLEMDSEHFLWRSRAAFYTALWGDPPEAERLERGDELLREALDYQPWSPITLRALHEVAIERGDEEAEAMWSERLCALDLCPPPVDATGGS